MQQNKIILEVMGEMTNQTSILSLRLTENEHNFLKEAKRDNRISINLYIRYLIRERMYEYEGDET